MSLPACMLHHTERQCQAWMAWLEMQWNKPDRTDYYLMQVAATMAGKKGAKLSDFRIKFSTVEKTDNQSKQPPSSQDIKQRTMEARSTWASRLGGPPIKE